MKMNYNGGLQIVKMDSLHPISRQIWIYHWIQRSWVSGKKVWFVDFLLAWCFFKNFFEFRLKEIISNFDFIPSSDKIDFRNYKKIQNTAGVKIWVIFQEKLE